MRQRSMNAITLAGFAAGFTTAAQADVYFSQIGPFELAGGESVSFSVGVSGSMSGCNWNFDWFNPGDSSWASDLQITITDPNSNSVSIAGHDNQGLPVSYDGPGSGPTGTYGDNIAVDGLSGAGFWTVTVTNDFSADEIPSVFSNFEMNIQGPGKGYTPAPGTGATAFLALGAFSARRRRF